MIRRLLGLAACLALTPIALAEVVSKPQEDGAGFRPLFNGKDLKGWVTPEDKALFTVEDGEIVGRTRGDLKKNEFLATEETYGAFVLNCTLRSPTLVLGRFALGAETKGCRRRSQDRRKPASDQS